MQLQGKIAKTQALDMPQFKKSGWKVIHNRAFKNVDPAIVAELDPMPTLQR